MWKVKNTSCRLTRRNKISVRSVESEDRGDPNIGRVFKTKGLAPFGVEPYAQKLALNGPSGHWWRTMSGE